MTVEHGARCVGKGDEAMRMRGERPYHATVIGVLRRAAAGLAAMTIVFGTVIVSSEPASAESDGTTCENPSDSGQVVEEVSWHQEWLDPESIWPFTTGAGVRVAVIDSGVDSTHPQLDGQVLAGWDAVTNADGGTLDCVSHGTAVASIIAATAEDGVGFKGLAPGVKIIPIRIAEDDITQDPENATTELARLTTAIRKAVDKGADVIDVSVVTYAPDAELESAIQYAISKDVVIVAAVGDQHRTDGQADLIPYPAAYDGVIGVGAIDATGLRETDSQVGSYVDLVAPGDTVIAATRAFGHTTWTGTSFAVPVVAAAAALVRSAEPDLTSTQIEQRLLATADPSRGGIGSQEYGIGVVNLYRAVTERASTAEPGVLAALPAESVDPVAEERAQAWHTTGVIAKIIAASVVFVTILVVAWALVLPRGRLRRWRPTRRPAKKSHLAASEIDDPQEAFYTLPSTAVSD